VRVRGYHNPEWNRIINSGSCSQIFKLEKSNVNEGQLYKNCILRIKINFTLLTKFYSKLYKNKTQLQKKKNLKK
jgi:hypothetical protein